MLTALLKNFNFFLVFVGMDTLVSFVKKTLMHARKILNPVIQAFSAKIYRHLQTSQGLYVVHVQVVSLEMVLNV